MVFLVFLQHDDVGTKKDFSRDDHRVLAAHLLSTIKGKQKTVGLLDDTKIRDEAGILCQLSDELPLVGCTKAGEDKMNKSSSYQSTRED